MDVTIRDLDPDDVESLAQFVKFVIKGDSHIGYFNTLDDMVAAKKAAMGYFPSSYPSETPVGRTAPQPPTIPNAPTFTPPPPPVADPAPEVANGAAPSLPPSNVIALPVGQTDARGVVWHPTWHSGDVGKPGLNKNGSWKKRKNSDDAGHAAYEALFLTAKKDAVAEVFAEFTTVPTFTPPPPAVAPVAEVIVPPPGTPGVADFEGLWAKLVADQKVNADIENWFIATFGGHPVHSFVYRNDPVKRLNAYNQMKFYAT